MQFSLPHRHFPISHNDARGDAGDTWAVLRTSYLLMGTKGIATWAIFQTQIHITDKYRISAQLLKYDTSEKRSMFFAISRRPILRFTRTLKPHNQTKRRITGIRIKDKPVSALPVEESHPHSTDDHTPAHALSYTSSRYTISTYARRIFFRSVPISAPHYEKYYIPS